MKKRFLMDTILNIIATAISIIISQLSIPFQNDHHSDEAEHWESTSAGIGGLIKKNIHLENESNLITLKKML